MDWIERACRWLAEPFVVRAPATDWASLVGKRVLVRLEWGIAERDVIEISPLGRLVKLEVTWYEMDKVELLEVLSGARRGRV